MLPIMTFKEIPLEEIDFSDESFRISEELDSAAILDSLRAIGQLNPVCLLDREPGKVIVCGFRRLRALKQLGNTAVARILSENECKPIQALDLALWDNLSHRRLHLLEKARVLLKLRHTCALSEKRIVERYLPLLDLTPRESVLLSCMSLNSLHPDIRRCLLDGRLTQGSVEYLAGTPWAVQADVAALMDKIRLSASMQRKVLNLLEELAAMGEVPLTGPLKNAEIQAALSDTHWSAFQKGERLHEVLYRLRNPRLARAAEHFMEQKKSLGLPAAIEISTDPFFETPGLRVEFNASTPGRFRNLAAALQSASQMPVLEELFDVR